MLPLLRIIPVGGVFFAIMIVVLALNPPGDSRAPLSATARGALVDANAHPEWRQFLIHAAIRRADELERLRDLPDSPVRIPPAVAEEPAAVAAAPVDRAPAVRPPVDIAPVDTIPAAAPPAPVAPAEPDVAPAPEPAVTITEAPVVPAPANDVPIAVAGLPQARADAGPNGDAASPDASIHVDIGVRSVTELLPVTAEPDVAAHSPAALIAPIPLPPQRAKPAQETKSKPIRRVRRAKAAAKGTPKNAPRAAQKPAAAPAPTNLIEILFGPLQPQRQQAGSDGAAPGGDGAQSAVTQR